MKTIAVIGLGKFGSYIAKSLARQNVTVIAIDNDEKKIQEISEYIDHSYVVDSTNKQALEEIGIYNLKTVIVSIGENIESSILTVMALKDLNNERIIAKAITNTHGEILSKIGAFKVIYPEKLAGRMLVRKFVDEIPLEDIDVSNSVKVLKIVVNESYELKKIKEIEHEFKNLKIVGFKNKEEGELIFNIDPNYEVQIDDVLILLGESKYVKDIYPEI